MPDRTATPEEQLDQWLDALNAPGGATPPAPASIAGLAEVALDYRRALAPSGASASTERNGTMPHALATPNGATWRTLARPARRRIDWGSWLATAAVFALLVGLVGGAAMRTWGLPGEDDPSHLAGVAASPAATPAAGALSCASPGYLAVVSGDPNSGDLEMLGGPDRVIRSMDEGVFVPLPDGETRELARDSVVYPDSDLALAIHDDNSATVTRISTGETWEYPAVKPRVEGQPYWDFFTNGRYVIGPTDDSRTDWLITDTLTGDTRTTADILGAPFEGPLDLWTQATSDTGDTWLLQFMTLTFSDHDETPPANIVDAPGYLVIPGSLNDAWFSDSPVDAKPIETVVSPEGTSFIVNQVVRDARTGERLDAGEDNLTFFGHFIGYLDESTLLTYSGDAVNTIDTHDGIATPVHIAPSDIQSVAWDADAGTLAVGSGSRGPASWVLLDLATGEATPLPDLEGYQLANVSLFGPVGRIEGAAAFTRPENGGDIGVRALDMRAGAVSDPVITRTDTRVDGLQATVPAWGSGRFIRTTDDAGTPVFIDAATGTVVTLPFPDGIAAPDGGQLDFSVVPEGTCATLTPRDADGNATGNTWIAPIEPGATWTELPFELESWWTVPTDEPQVLPAQDFATPATATPETAAQSCASPGYIPVVWGEVNPDVLTEIGATDAIVRGETTTITAANGTEITFGPDEQWMVYPNRMIFSGDDLRAPSAVTSLATGKSWPVPTPASEPSDGIVASYTILGEWLFVPVDASYTDWHVINSLTGDERLTSDLFGAPFASSRATVNIGGPWAFDNSPPAIVGFLADEGGDMATLVLPSGDLDDAWAPEPVNAVAAMAGVISSDGHRIAYVDPLADRVVVLDGFTGDRVGYYRAPDAAGDILQPVGLTGDDTKLILRDNQRVWTVDLASGEIATVFDPGGDIHDFAFDPTTGTAIASSGDDVFTWLDPATGETKDLDIPLPMRFPEPQFGWALIQIRDDIAVDYALLDMTTGEIVTEPIAADRDENGTNVWITGGDDTGVFVVQAESGRMLVLDGPGGQAFDLAALEASRDGWNGVSIGVSPNGGCLVYTKRGEGEEPGVSWIAPLEPVAEWTALPFELGPWIEMPPAPAEPVASPVATPAASPVATP